MPEPEASYEPVCVTCQGRRWVGRNVPVGDPHFGQALPCPSCIDPGEQVHRLVYYANLPASMGLGFDDFQRSAGVESAWQAAVQFAKNPRGILTLYGPNGTGKSHLLVAIGNELLSRGVAVKYAFVPDLLEEVRSTFSEGSESTAQQIYEQHRYADVLLLDDVTEKRVTPLAVDVITRLVDERYRNDRALAVATNLGLEAMGHPELWGPRLADRLFDDHNPAIQAIAITGLSYRTGRRWSLPWGRK